MPTAENKQTKKDNIDVSTFLSDLNSAINFRSSRSRNRNTTKRFYYTCGSTNILLEKNLSVENISKRSINKIPHCQEWHEGIISVRGTIVPVINMAKFLEDTVNTKEKQGKKETQFLLINHDEHQPIVLQIDELPTMTNIKNYSTKKAPSKSPNWYQSKLIDDDTHTIIKVDHNKLLNLIIQEQ